MLGEEGILPEFLFPLLSGEEMHSSFERKISHEIVSSGRSGDCGYEYVDGSAKGKRKTVLPVVIAALSILAFMSAASFPAMASTTNITTYFDVTATVSISVTFPTGYTNVSFTDSQPTLGASNVSANGQQFNFAAVEITNSGDTNITSLTAGFTSHLASILGTNASGKPAIMFIGLQSTHNGSMGLTSFQYLTPAGSDIVYWINGNATTAQNLLGGTVSPNYLEAYSSPNDELFLWMWATFAPQTFAGHGTDTFVITYAA